MHTFNASDRSDEDCLSLNVWTPGTDDHLRPTMVWIHGGGFQSGSGSSPIYSGQGFITSETVLVTLNYRLHALGFLYLDELFGMSGSANVGLTDQIAALRWVQDNIAAFGGDPANVTVVGESAGAMSIGCLMAMPGTAELFSRAIVQSGAGKHVIGPSAATDVARHVLDEIEVKVGDMDSLLATSAERITSATASLTPSVVAELFEHEFSASMAFQPVVDGINLRTSPTEAIKSGASDCIDLLIGTCADELRLVTWGMARGGPTRPFDPAVARQLSRRGISIEHAVATYERDHPGDAPLDYQSAMETDFRYTFPAAEFALAHQPFNPNVWVYRFDWGTPILDGALRACHAIEVPFVFRTLAEAGEFVGPNPPEVLAKLVHSAWVAFARTGDPSVPGLSPWPRYEESRRTVAVLDIVPSLADDPWRERRLLWLEPR